MKVKELDKVLDIMDEGCSEYCSLGNCEIAIGWNEHLEASIRFYYDMVSWGMYK